MQSRPLKINTQHVRPLSMHLHFNETRRCYISSYKTLLSSAERQQWRINDVGAV